MLVLLIEPLLLEPVHVLIRICGNLLKSSYITCIVDTALILEPVHVLICICGTLL